MDVATGLKHCKRIMPNFFFSLHGFSELENHTKVISDKVLLGGGMVSPIIFSSRSQ